MSWKIEWGSLLSSIAAYLSTPSQNSVDNILERDVIGNKADTAVTTANTTSSQMAYLKGLLSISGSGAGTYQLKTTTISLNQASAGYILFTGSVGAVDLEKLVIQMPALAAGGALTGIYIQTNDATPQVLITTVQGLVVNLTSGNQLTWEGICRVGLGKLIQLYIMGGATGVNYVCTVSAHFRAEVAGGTLA